MQLLLEPGAQALRQHRRRARGADGDRHLAAIDDRRQREGAKLGPVGHVDRHAERARDGRDAGILLVVLGRGDDERAAAQLIDAGRGAISDTSPSSTSAASSGTTLIGGDVDETARASAAAAP